LVRAVVGDDSTVRLFSPCVSSIIGEQLFPKELDELSNVIKDHRAKLGSMREKNDHKNSSPDNEYRPDDPDRSLSISGEPAPIDIVAFGKRLAGVVNFVQTSSGISLTSITPGPSPTAHPGGPRLRFSRPGPLSSFQQFERYRHVQSSKK
jgi:hypothetical protein